MTSIPYAEPLSEKESRAKVFLVIALITSKIDQECQRARSRSLQVRVQFASLRSDLQHQVLKPEFPPA